MLQATQITLEPLKGQHGGLTVSGGEEWLFRFVGSYTLQIQGRTHRPTNSYHRRSTKNASDCAKQKACRLG